MVNTHATPRRVKQTLLFLSPRRQVSRHPLAYRCGTPGSRDRKKATRLLLAPRPSSPDDTESKRVENTYRDYSFTQRSWLGIRRGPFDYLIRLVAPCAKGIDWQNQQSLPLVSSLERYRVNGWSPIQLLCKKMFKFHKFHQIYLAFK